MNVKLAWHEIEKHYDQEWVELIEYDWPEEEPHPRSGVVRIHARSRKNFDQLLLQDPPSDSAVVFVGERKLPKGVILSANLFQVGSL